MEETLQFVVHDNNISQRPSQLETLECPLA